MRTKWGYVLIRIVLIIQRSFTTSSQLTQPMNTVSFVGNRVNMSCSSNSSLPIEWEFTAAGSSDFIHIYTVGQITESLSSKYRIDTDGKTRYDIVIDSVDFSHAGKYRCTPNTEEVISLSYTAQIIVLASDPVCNTNASALNGHIVEGDYIRIWCTVNYTGNWIPVMEWTRTSGQTVDANIIYTNTSTTVTSSLTVQLYSNDNRITFKCKTSFNPTSTKINVTLKQGETLVTNVPKYQHLWDFVATVLYAPRNLTIIPKKSAYEFGDRLMCWANGNPPPTYEWKEIETNRTIHGTVLTMDDYVMRSDKNHSFRCSAYNIVAGIKRQIAETVTFTVRGRPEIPTEQPIIISIIVVGAVCCFVLTLYLCKNRCPYKSGIVRPEPDILQAVQINPYDIAESLEDHPTNRLRSVQAARPPGVEGCNLQQLPLPVYAEVRRKENKPMNSDGLRQTVETTGTQYRLPPRTLTGADGTQYLDVTSIRDQISRAPTRHPPMFSQVETYASIDHTVDAPPPLPPKRQ